MTQTNVSNHTYNKIRTQFCILVFWKYFWKRYLLFLYIIDLNNKSPKYDRYKIDLKKIDLLKTAFKIYIIFFTDKQAFKRNYFCLIMDILKLLFTI